MATDLISDQFADRILTRTARHREFFGHWLVRYQLAATLLDEAAVARILGLTLGGLATLALCKVPRPACWAHDLRQVAERVGVCVSDLAALLEKAGYRGSPLEA